MHAQDLGFQAHCAHLAPAAVGNHSTEHRMPTVTGAECYNQTTAQDLAALVLVELSQFLLEVSDFHSYSLLEHINLRRVSELKGPPLLCNLWNITNIDFSRIVEH